MMWGPGVARAAADLALTGRTDVLDVTDLGLDRFDEHGRSRLATDPIALPFPVDADEPAEAGALADAMAAAQPLVLAAGPARLEVSAADGGRVTSFRLDGQGADRPRRRRPDLVGQLPDGAVRRRIRRGFSFGGRESRLPLNLAPHAIHGVVFDRPWDVVIGNSMSVRLGAPWPFAGP